MNTLPFISILSFATAAFSAHCLMSSEPHRRNEWQVARFVATFLAVLFTAIVVWRS